MTPVRVILACLITAALGCRGDSNTPSRESDRARELVERMSSTIAAAPAFTVTTREVRDRMTRTGKNEIRTAIAVGTMLARPLSAAVTVAVGGSTYWHADNAFYTRVVSGGDVVYQVVAPPVGAVIRTLPPRAPRCAWVASPTLNAVPRTTSA